MNLEKLITDIKKEHEQVGLAVRKSLDHARKAGELLSKAKAEVDKSDFKWARWVENKCGITERMAANYIRIHKNWSKIKEKAEAENFDPASLSVRAALSLLKKRARKPKPRFTLADLATKMERFGIHGEPEKLLELLKDVGVKLPVATEEPQAATA